MRQNIRRICRFFEFRQMSSFANDRDPKITGGSVRWILKQN